MEEPIVHLRTQRAQPYGSERRCCERCGLMVWPAMQQDKTPPWTDDEAAYEAHAGRCDRVKQPHTTEAEAAVFR